MGRYDVLWIIFLVFVSLLISMEIMDYRREERPQPQEPWTEQEQLCAGLMASTEHGDQYTERERLRMCRVYIEQNGGFGNDDR